MFEYLISDKPERFLLSSQAFLATGKKPRFPVYIFNGSFDAGALLIDSRKITSQVAYDLRGRLGVLYANSPDLQFEYIQQLSHVAQSAPESNYIIVLAS